MQMSLSGIKLSSNFMRATLPFVGRWTSVFVFGDSFSTRKTLTAVYSSARPQASKNLLWNPLGLQTNPGQWDQHWCIGFILFSFFCDFNFETTVVLPTARPPTNHPHSLICIGTCVPSPIDSIPTDLLPRAGLLTLQANNTLTALMAAPDEGRGV